MCYLMCMIRENKNNLKKGFKMFDQKERETQQAVSELMSSKEVSNGFIIGVSLFVSAIGACVISAVKSLDTATVETMKSFIIG